MHQSVWRWKWFFCQSNYVLQRLRLCRTSDTVFRREIDSLRQWGYGTCYGGIVSPLRRSVYFLLHFTNTIVTHKPLQITRRIVTQQNLGKAEAFLLAQLAGNEHWLATEVWFRASGKFGRQNGDDQCWKLLPEKRQIPWPTVDIVWFDRDQTLQQYVVHHVANSRRWAFRSCVGCRAQKNGLKWTKNDLNWGQNR